MSDLLTLSASDLGLYNTGTTTSQGSFTAATSPVKTSAFDWNSLLSSAVAGTTTVLAAQALAKSSSGTQVAAAASTPTTSSVPTTTATSATVLGMPANTAALLGGVLIVGLVALIVTRRS